MRPLVVVETPYNTEHFSREECVRYALWCAFDSILRGEAPFLSHLLYTQFLPEDRESRNVGLACRDAWVHGAGALVARYVDLGVTPGMVREADEKAKLAVELRHLPIDRMRAWGEGKYPKSTILPTVVG